MGHMWASPLILVVNAREDWLLNVCGPQVSAEQIEMWKFGKIAMSFRR